VNTNKHRVGKLIVKTSQPQCEGCGCHSVEDGYCEQCEKWMSILQEVKENRVSLTKYLKAALARRRLLKRASVTRT